MTNLPLTNTQINASLNSKEDKLESLIGHLTRDDKEEIQKTFEDRMPEKLISNLSIKSTNGDFFEAAKFVSEGMQVIVDDQFSRAFKKKNYKPWNFEKYLYPVWILGVLFRYLVLFPLRVLIWVGGFFLIAVIFIIGSLILMKNKQKKLKFQTYMIKSWALLCFVSWSAVVRYHGTIPPKTTNNGKSLVFVANHTTLNDVVLLFRRQPCSIVGQRHSGFVGFLQNYVFAALDPVWFERWETKDRQSAIRKIKNRLNSGNVPLLLFPEGTCVNNEYCVMFKKGAFELDATIIPIAIKYNKLFANAYWNSREQSFLMHTLSLWASWAVIADVYFFPPQNKLPDETSTQFANRVKAMICRKAHLINCNADGYLKHVKLNENFIKHRQSQMANFLKKRFNLKEEENQNENQNQNENEKEKEKEKENIQNNNNNSQSEKNLKNLKNQNVLQNKKKITKSQSEIVLNSKKEK
ncbi:acyltransferase-like [Anaeramoeba ignava]|uniref:Acyltransferase-like n=1 Tax=Anaeramoeba ignava TaxID=1746090 RepID=A0A9Q0LF07_ANAIG|nr:acyltransferase-like [Anaeramoeba ignava]